MNFEQETIFLVRVEEIASILKNFLPKAKEKIEEKIVKTDLKNTIEITNLNLISKTIDELHERIAIEFLYGVSKENTLEFGYKVAHFWIRKEKNIKFLEEVLKKNGVYYQKINLK